MNEWMKEHYERKSEWNEKWMKENEKNEWMKKMNERALRIV